MKYRRMPIEMESPEELGYGNIRCNLAESSVTDAKWEELGITIDSLTLAYGDHKGLPALRELIAAEHGLHAEDVLLTPGAAAGLFITATSVLEREDHLVVQFPNYSTNIETAVAIGCAVSQVEMRFEEKFRLDLEKLKQQLTPRTRLISVTNPHNPTGTMLTLAELQQLIRIAEQQDCFLLVDETYRDLAFGEKPPLAATLSDRVISISSVSKAHGLPGIRIGWMITQNKKLQEIFLAAKEQIFICNSGLDEEVAFRFLQDAAARKNWVKTHVTTNFSIVKKWMENNPVLEWITPSGGCVCFPRFKKSANVDVEKFYSTLNNQYRTFPGPGHWFGMDRSYMRIGFGWPSENELREGLENILVAAKSSAKE